MLPELGKLKEAPREGLAWKGADPQPLAECRTQPQGDGSAVRFTAPAQPGFYRLYVWVSTAATSGGAAGDKFATCAPVRPVPRGRPPCHVPRGAAGGVQVQSSEFRVQSTVFRVQSSQCSQCWGSICGSAPGLAQKSMPEAQPRSLKIIQK